MIDQRKRGLTIPAVLIASVILLALTAALMTSFKTTFVQGPSRLSFDISTKNLDAHLEKVVDHLKNSDSHGVASTVWGTDGRVLSIQRQVGVDSLGTVSWEEKLHLYWKEDSDTRLHYADIPKSEASLAGLELDSRYATKPSDDQLKFLATAREGKSKILHLSLVEFEVSEGWKTAPEAIEIRWAIRNPKLSEQRYQTKAAVWLDTP